MAKSAYLFFAYTKDEVPLAPFSLDDLPHSNSTEMLSTIITSLPPLSSALVCDPRYTITGAEVLLDTNQTITILSSGIERVNNIHDPSANVLFSTPLTDALTQMEPKRESFSINTLTTLLFFNQDQTLSADYISRQLNAFTLSASKAFNDGYKPSDGRSSFGTFESVRTTAVLRVEKLGVITNKLFFFVSVGLVTAISVLTMTTFVGWRKLKNYPLCIACVVKGNLAPSGEGS